MRTVVRFLRPQFSLRAILLLMGIVGVALAVWRWPWQEESKQHPKLEAAPECLAMHNSIARTRMQYRRGWWGEQLRYGVAESFDWEGRIVARQTWYDDALHGPEIWYDLAGRPIVEQNRRNNVRSGPFRYGDGFRWKMSGQFERALRTGQCRDEEEWQSGVTVERIGQYLDGKLHGPCTWLVAETGEVLQRGVFELGAIVEWNGQPVQNHLEQWAAADKLANRHLAQLLRDEAVNKAPPEQIYTLHSDSVSIQTSPSMTVTFFLNLDPSLRSVFTPPADHQLLGIVPADRATDEILAALIPSGLTIDERYGGLWIAAAEDRGLWRDPSGVAQITPPPNSKLAEAWNKEARFRSYDDKNRQLEPLEELAIWWPENLDVTIDIRTHFPERHAHYGLLGPQPKRDLPNDSAGELRHWLGEQLYRAGLQCELKDDRIVVLPHWSQHQMPAPE